MRGLGRVLSGRRKARNEVCSGETVREAGYYLYAGHADKNQAPCDPTDDERAIVLERGATVPLIHSCSGHRGRWVLLVEKPAS